MDKMIQEMTPEAQARKIVIHWRLRHTVDGDLEHDIASALAAKDREIERLAAFRTRWDAMEGALAELYALIEEGLLVRKTANDSHFPLHLKELRIVNAVSKAQAALAAGQGRGNESH